MTNLPHFRVLTYCSEILLRCREGLNLRNEQWLSTYFTANSLVALMRYADGKLYKLEISEVKGEAPNFITKPD